MMRDDYARGRLEPGEEYFPSSNGRISTERARRQVLASHNVWKNAAQFRGTTTAIQQLTDNTYRPIPSIHSPSFFIAAQKQRMPLHEVARNFARSRQGLTLESECPPSAKSVVPAHLPAYICSPRAVFIGRPRKPILRPSLTPIDQSRDWAQTLSGVSSQWGQKTRQPRPRSQNDFIGSHTPLNLSATSPLPVNLNRIPWDPGGGLIELPEKLSNNVKYKLREEGLASGCLPPGKAPAVANRKLKPTSDVNGIAGFGSPGEMPFGLRDIAAVDAGWYKVKN